MEEKYIKFYKSFHKAFQNKKSNSLFKLISYGEVDLNAPFFED